MPAGFFSEPHSVTLRTPKEVTMEAAEKLSLYDKLGGVYSIATVVDEFIDRVMTDPRLNAILWWTKRTIGFRLRVSSIWLRRWSAGPRAGRKSTQASRLRTRMPI